MAKTRAQRKAEKRRREQAQKERQARDPEAEARDEVRAQHDTQVPVSGDVAEIEAVMETGARPEEYGEHVGDQGEAGGAQARAAVPGVTPEPVVAPPPEAPAPSRADVGRPADLEAPPAEKGPSRRERAAQKAQDEKAAGKRRNPIIAFLASCWAELKKVQWPDRDTLVQASAVTLIFVVVMATYLGSLDAIFNWLVKQII
jgi:preprotein translocase SecE subunit